MRTWMMLAGVTCVAASSALAQNPSPRDVESLPTRPPHLRASYGPDSSLQFGELRLPKGSGPFPVAVIIHGGCWARGVATLTNTAAVASALLDDGIATWNIEYRLPGDPGGGWPGTFLDVGASVDYVRTLASRYPLDLRRVVVVGHSAGAHFALWAAARPRLPARSNVRGSDPLMVRAAVALDGPTDLAPIVGGEAKVCGKPVIAPLMGGTPAEVPDRYRDVSPKEMLPLGVRQYLVTASLMNGADAQAYETAARPSGDSVTVTHVATGGHFGVIAPGHPAWVPVRQVIRQAVGLPPE